MEVVSENFEVSTLSVFQAVYTYHLSNHANTGHFRHFLVTNEYIGRNNINSVFIKIQWFKSFTGFQFNNKTTTIKACEINYSGRDSVVTGSGILILASGSCYNDQNKEIEILHSISIISGPSKTIIWQQS